MKDRYNRRDKCKCGKFFYWDTDSNRVVCPHCETVYKVDCDSVLVYWLVEDIRRDEPFTTDAR